MTLGIDYAKKIREDARLIILRALDEQTNSTLASNILEELVLPMFGIRQERPWVHQQLDYLANMGAVTLIQAGTIKVATLTKTGKRHVDRDLAIEGVTRPSLVEG